MNKQELYSLLEPYNRNHLECDGATRVFAWILKKNKIPYTIYSGRLERKSDEYSIVHYWIEIEDSGLIVDFKARMWMGDNERVPHGVFDADDYPDVLYLKECEEEILITKTVCEILLNEVKGG